MDAVALYRKHAKKKVDGLPKAPLSAAERKALKADIQNLAEIAKRKQLDCCTPREIAYDQSFAREHFEMACWLKWFMANGRARDEIEAGALIIFLLFEWGVTKPAYEFSALTDFGERTFDNILERDEGEDVIIQLNALVDAHGTQASRDGLANYKWDRPPYRAAA